MSGDFMPDAAPAPAASAILRGGRKHPGCSVDNCGYNARKKCTIPECGQLLCLAHMSRAHVKLDVLDPMRTGCGPWLDPNFTVPVTVCPSHTNAAMDASRLQDQRVAEATRANELSQLNRKLDQASATEVPGLVWQKISIMHGARCAIGFLAIFLFLCQTSFFFDLLVLIGATLFTVTSGSRNKTAPHDNENEDASSGIR